MPTVADIDEALLHCSLVPPIRRGPGYETFVDNLLDFRLALIENAELNRIMREILTR